MRMALRKYAPPGNVPLVGIKPLSFSSKVHENAQHVDAEARVEPDVDIDLREVYFLIMHFLSAGPCHRTCGQFWNELLEHQLLPRRYHAWHSRGGAITGDENDDGLSFPLSYNKLADRYTLTSLILLLSKYIHWFFFFFYTFFMVKGQFEIALFQCKLLMMTLNACVYCTTGVCVHWLQ